MCKTDTVLWIIACVCEDRGKIWHYLGKKVMDIIARSIVFRNKIKTISTDISNDFKVKGHLASAVLSSSKD